MKKNILILLITLLFLQVNKSLAQYAAQNITLYANWNDPNVVSEPVYNIKYNSVWGWVDSTGKEYAIIGSTAGTYFIDVTNPSTPVVKDYVAGKRDSCIWREYKTYGKYLYIVSDDPAPNSFQIIDLSYLPDSVHVVYDSNSIFTRSHTLFIDGNKLYCASVSSANNYASLAVFSLANPELPSLLRELNQDYPNIGYTHDMFVRNDTVYVSAGDYGLFIFKFESNNTFNILGSVTQYPDQGYNHSSSLTADGKTLIFCDEVPAGLGVKSVDVSDFNNLTVLKTFYSNTGATPHNPYVIGNDKVVIAYYQDGVQIFDISDPANPVKTGYFDTDTLNGLNNNYPDNPTYQGCWGAYTDLPSGVLLASDMQNGLYILNASAALSVPSTNVFNPKINLYPNPTKDNFNFSINLKNVDEINYEVTDITRRTLITKNGKLQSGNSTVIIDSKNLATGIYVVKIKGKEFSANEKLIKTN